MYKKAKELRRLSKEIHRAKKAEFDEEGRQIVRIGVSDDSDFLSPFSAGENAVIAGDTAEFIEHSLKHINPGATLHFRIDGKTIDENEKIIYDKAIREYYHSEFIEVSREIRKNTLQSLILTFIAAFVFALAVVLDSIGVQSVVLNMIDVVAWVFMWEAADIFIFQRSSLKLRRARFLQIIRSKITFI
ncbi:MAG: hypothetical protein ACI4QZ_08315 [Eubacteriales bacterium]